MSSLSLLAKAERMLSQERWDPAHTLLSRALTGSPDPFLHAEILYRDGEALRALGRYQEALARYQKAERFTRELRIPSERVQSLQGASACLRILGRYGEARRLWSRVERARFFRLPPSVLGEIELERALVARGQGKFGEARRRVQRALPGLARRKDGAGLQHAHWVLGGLERFSGHLRRSLSAFRKAVHLARRLGDPSLEAFALCGLGGVERVLGLDRLSSAHYFAAGRIVQRIQDPFGQAYALCGRANAHRAFGNAALTLPLYRQSAALYRRLGDESSEGFAHWGSGGSLRRLGRFAASARAYDMAEQLFRKSKDDRGLVMLGLGRARLAEDQGRPAQALQHARRALALARVGHLIYESALARYEIGRLRRPHRPPHRLLRPLGIRLGALRRWRDIP